MRKMPGFFVILVLFSTMSMAKHYTYISIDGGGVLGVIPAHLLDGVEIQTQQPIYKMVDGIMGTSTGAITASLLSIPTEEELPWYYKGILGGIIPPLAKAVVSFIPKYYSPYQAFEVVAFYKIRGISIFEAAKNSMTTEQASQPIRQEEGDSQERLIIKNKIDSIFGKAKLSSALTNLWILSNNRERNSIYLFDSKTAGEDILASDAVQASAASFAVTPFVTDATTDLYEKIRDMLHEEDTATIYSMGTGFAPMSEATKQLMANPDKIEIIRIQPNISHLAFNPQMMLSLSVDTSKKNMNALLEVAERLKTTQEYRRMLDDLQMIAHDKKELRNTR